jgi:hypothetical protein
MRISQVPKIEIRDGEVWICIGHKPYNESFGIITPTELAARDAYIAENERKRMAFVLDHMEEFAAWVQWHGSTPKPGTLLPVEYPWAFEAKEKT